MSGFGPDESARIIRRDQTRCAWCGNGVRGRRGVDWSIHHRRARGMGGSRVAWVNEAANGVVVCGNGTQGCHSEIESQKALAIELGFTVGATWRFASNEVPIKHAVLGWVLLDNDGGYVPFKKEVGEERAHAEG